MVLLGSYGQRECQITSLVFQNKFYSLLPRGFNIFQQQIITCNSCRPTRRHHDHSSFWYFLQWWILILVSHTRIFQQVLFLVLNLFPECIIPSDFLMLMDVFAILFCTNTYIDKVQLDRLFLQGWVKFYLERHWICPRQK